MTKKNLPVKVIMPREKDSVVNSAGGRDKFFREVTPEFIGEISGKFAALINHYKEVFDENESVPAVAKLIIRGEAAAKSHRPDELCKETDIIGDGGLKKLYIKITKKSVERTINRISSPRRSKKLSANLTTIDDILPVFDNEKISENIEKAVSEKTDIKFKKLKIKCFDFGNEHDNETIRRHVMGKIKAAGYDPFCRSFGQKLSYMRLENVSADDIPLISSINGIRSIDLFREYSLPIRQTDAGAAFSEESDVPLSDTVIGVIDSGISENSPMEKFVIGREIFVAPEYQNRKHGTFVASCLEYGSILDGIEEDGKTHFKLIDVIAIPNKDPNHGLTGVLSQDDFFEIAEEVVRKYRSTVRFWNISLGSDDTVKDGEVSDLAVFCDYLQEEYGVQMEIAGGNYGGDGEELRRWPPQELKGKDRVTAPADSMRGVVVGSLALYDGEGSVVKKNEPSPFSRRGPGSNYAVKPDVVDYGGNMTEEYDIRGLGVKVIDEEGRIAEDVGTSFAAPKITYKLAKIYDSLVDRDILVSKAFLIHDASMNAKTSGNDPARRPYCGFGHPSYDAGDILRCDENEITLLFKQTIERSTHLELPDFPFPKCLIKNGKYTGEIFMTLAYAPPLDPRYGSRYCRTNIDVSFGTYEAVGEKFEFRGQVPLEKRWTEKFEQSQVKEGYKWSPVKSYYRNLGKGICEKDGWKIRIDMVERDDNEPKQEFVLIVTIRGKKGDAVYDDVVLELQNKGFITANLETRYQIRERI